MVVYYYFIYFNNYFEKSFKWNDWVVFQSRMHLQWFCSCLINNLDSGIEIRDAKAKAILKKIISNQNKKRFLWAISLQENNLFLSIIESNSEKQSINFKFNQKQQFLLIFSFDYFDMMWSTQDTTDPCNSSFFVSFIRSVIPHDQFINIDECIDFLKCISIT